MTTRVLVLTTTFPRHEGDGTPRFVSDLAIALADRFELMVLTPRVPGALASEIVRGVQVRRFPYAPRRFEGLADGAIVANVRAKPWRIAELPLLSFSMWRHMRRLVDEFEPHVIHAHWTIPTGLIASLLPRRLQRPVVITSHGVDLHAFAHEPLETLRRLALTRADVVTTVSTELADRARSIAGLTDVPIIPMGVDTSPLIDIDRLHRSGNRVLFVGRLADKKGVSFLLDALARLDATTASIIGDGPLRSALEAQAVRLGLGERVEFLGQQDRDQVLAAMRTCSVLVIPSVTAANGDREGTPVVLAEAIAQRTPIVATSVGGLGERLDHTNAWPVAESDAAALAGAIAAALADPLECDRRADRAFTDVLPDLDLRETARAYAQIFDRLASPSGS